MSKTKRQGQRDLVKICEEQGFKVTPTRKGYRIMSPTGRGMYHLHMTPSEHRSFKNTVSDLRRIGVKL